MTHFGPHLDPFLTPFDPINQGENGVLVGSKKGSKKGQKWVKNGVKKGSEIAWNGTKMTTFGTLFGVMHSSDVQMPLPLWIAYVYWPDCAKMVIRWKRVKKVPFFTGFQDYYSWNPVKYVKNPENWQNRDFPEKGSKPKGELSGEMRGQRPKMPKNPKIGVP